MGGSLGLGQREGGGGVDHVEFASRKFWIVGKVNAFIAKLPTDFVHAVKATNHELFQVTVQGVRV
jgi:hypothetical protein